MQKSQGPLHFVRSRTLKERSWNTRGTGVPQLPSVEIDGASMKSILNTHVYATTSVRSASIGVLGAVIHQIPEPGRYIGTVFRDGSQILELRLSVDEAHPCAKCEIDLSRRKTAFGTERAEVACSVRPGGRIVFFSSGGRGGYHVCLYRMALDGQKECKAFDSRMLSDGDLFAVTLMRPGTYAVGDELGGGHGRIRVMHPAPGNGENWPSTPVHVSLTPARLDPEEVEVHPAQPVIFAVSGQNAALTVNLVASDEAGLAYMVTDNGGTRLSLRTG